MTPGSHSDLTIHPKVSLAYGTFIFVTQIVQKYYFRADVVHCGAVVRVWVNTVDTVNIQSHTRTGQRPKSLIFLKDIIVFLRYVNKDKYYFRAIPRQRPCGARPLCVLSIQSTLSTGRAFTFTEESAFFYHMWIVRSSI